MKAIFFGTYTNDPTIELFKKKILLQKIDVEECRVKIDFNLKKKNWGSVIFSFFKLMSKHKKIGKYDIVILPLWYGALQILLLKMISRKPIIYFGHGSPYDSLVNDRKKLKRSSMIAKMFYIFEKKVCGYSDIIIKESQAEIDYFCSQMKLSKEKFRVLWIGADESLFHKFPIKPQKKKLQILYIGTFIPSHGVDTIIEAANILNDRDDIVFTFCGDGQDKQKMEDLSKKYGLTNTRFLGYVSQEELLENMNNADICLGIFGKDEKSSIVVTHKVYQILCSQRPLITRESKAVREIGLKNNENCILVPEQNQKRLAEAILMLKENKKLRNHIAIQGREIYERKFSMKVTSVQLSQIINELIKKDHLE